MKDWVIPSDFCTIEHSLRCVFLDVDRLFPLQPNSTDAKELLLHVSRWRSSLRWSMMDQLLRWFSWEFDRSILVYSVSWHVSFRRGKDRTSPTTTTEVWKGRRTSQCPTRHANNPIRRNGSIIRMRRSKETNFDSMMFQLIGCVK